SGSGRKEQGAARCHGRRGAVAGISMTLKVELKPGERIVVGRSLITNGSSRSRLIIEGEEPVLRERDILTPETANTPARRIYLTVQLMYLRGDISDLKTA